jgi:hypothetical protein
MNSEFTYAMTAFPLVCMKPPPLRVYRTFGSRWMGGRPGTFSLGDSRLGPSQSVIEATAS